MLNGDRNTGIYFLKKEEKFIGRGEKANYLSHLQIFLND